jgi:ABC-2 type transport system ATP-binding protein
MAHAERLCDRLSIIAGGKVKFEGSVDDALGVLPHQAHYTPHHNTDGLRALLPADAERENGSWRFAVPQEGIEALLVTLINAGHGISGLSIERPKLHDVFVRIVGKKALEGSAA